MKKYKEQFAGKTQSELNQMLIDALKDLTGLRFQHKAGRLASPALIRHRRREIARIKTHLNQAVKN